jgi:hypothetical protein
MVFSPFLDFGTVAGPKLGTARRILVQQKGSQTNAHVKETIQNARSLPRSKTRRRNLQRRP